MNTEPCPKCGASKRVRGRTYGGGTFADVRFKPDDAAVFGSRKRKKTTALVCQKWGSWSYFFRITVIEAWLIKAGQRRGEPRKDSRKDSGRGGRRHADSGHIPEDRTRHAGLCLIW